MINSDRPESIDICDMDGCILGDDHRFAENQAGPACCAKRPWGFRAVGAALHWYLPWPAQDSDGRGGPRLSCKIIQDG